MPVNEPAQVYRSVGLADLLTDLLAGLDVIADTARFKCLATDDAAGCAHSEIPESASGPTTMPQ